MKDIAIYVEGGGQTAQQQKQLRIGLDALLRVQKEAARAKRLGWRMVPAGGRQATYDAFQAALQRAGDDTLAVLLVDAEASLRPQTQDKTADAQARVAHLARHDGWNFDNADALAVHLMVQCLEAWIVSDPDALSRHDGMHFHTNRLPVRTNLEEEPKGDLYKKLDSATRDTAKGAYHKIRHASKLLALIDADRVAQRCPRFETFTKWLTTAIEEG